MRRFRRFDSSHRNRLNYCLCRKKSLRLDSPSLWSPVHCNGDLYKCVLCGWKEPQLTLRQVIVCDNNSGVNAYEIYDVACFIDVFLKSPAPFGSVCNVQADSIALTGTGLLAGYNGTSGSPYVGSIQACAAECFSTSTCTNFYFVNGTSCNLHYGKISYVINNTGVNAYNFYNLACFNACPFPTPYQTGMAANCNKFHFVVSGD